MGQQQGIIDADDYCEGRGAGGKKREEGTWREEERGGRKINRKENLEQRTKLYFIFPSQITSNCSLVLAKGKTEGIRRGKFIK